MEKGRSSGSIYKVIAVSVLSPLISPCPQNEGSRWNRALGTRDAAALCRQGRETLRIFRGPRPPFGVFSQTNEG